ncbi:hypothetical protein GSI_07739 [Ganoderma sinense ZZ0214-1]|uniref:Uncharacterized protein n=1 Tax=Ganoderma sinense ZZ0214-1 TaxID=1077348 RepID=A0A2G8S8S8_9APHY|nr:hypothetical protein GSI_07739 [Ganoderma sinense ZZ0214-1]
MEEDAVKTVDFLLSYIIIPSDCHLYLTVLQNPSIKVNCGVLDSVCRHIPDKGHISHLALWLPDSYHPYDYGYDIGLQVVFPQGSLRLRFPAPRAYADDMAQELLRFLHAYPDIFATTTELRIQQRDMSLSTQRSRQLKDLQDALPAIFPNVKLMSIVAAAQSFWKESLQPCLQSLLPVSNASPPAPGMEPVTYPALETLWVTLHDLKKERIVAQLRAVLSERAALGFPVRRVIVAYMRSESKSRTPNTPQDSDRTVRDLLALDGIVDEVVLMEIPPNEDPSDADWLVRYPEKYALPADVRRDWPVWQLALSNSEGGK